MPNEARIFKYQKGNKVWRVAAIAVMLTVGVFVMDGAKGGFWQLLLLAVVTAVLLFLLGYMYLVNQQLEVSATALTVAKKVGRSRIIPFNTIRRIVLRAEADALEGGQLRMTVFSDGGNTKVLLSELEERGELIRLLDARGRDFGFSVVRQGVDGEVIT